MIVLEAELECVIVYRKGTYCSRGNIRGGIVEGVQRIPPRSKPFDKLFSFVQCFLFDKYYGFTSNFGNAISSSKQRKSLSKFS